VARTLGGQHVDVRLTAPDGYQAARSYSLAAPSDCEHIEITVQAVPDGEVSSYLVGDARPGDSLEVLGPVGGWAGAWRAANEPGTGPTLATCCRQCAFDVQILYQI
jgi:ferredoxin-NADP reductase